MDKRCSVECQPPYQHDVPILYATVEHDPLINTLWHVCRKGRWVLSLGVMKRAAGGSQPTGKKSGASSAAASVEKALKRVSAVANPLSSINDQDVARMLAIEVRWVHFAVERRVETC